MLQINNLTKVYSKGERKVTALNNVSFTLPNTGFVFITGKSGCGKSTLLNMLGGLDNATSGEIICDNNNLTKFSPSDFDNYRNTYLGFIFQDYCLIDDLNIKENILLALNLKGDELSSEEKENLVDNALSSVDLDINLKSRFVKELSGGQKQRVAIARALVKSPRLILADEPTGNLDSKTSTKILKVLKKLSQDRLVVIVSHNLEDAKTYASRIIELSDGEIISDVTRQSDKNNVMTISRGTLTLPDQKNLTPKEILEINNQLKNNKIKKIRQNGSGFRKTKKITDECTTVNFEHKKMSLKNTLKLSRFFVKKRILASIFTIVVISLLVFVLGVCQFFMQFNASNTVYSVMKQNNEEDILLYNGYYDEDNEIVKNKYIKFTDEQIAEFEESNYSGNIYKLYYDPISFSSHNGSSGSIVSLWNFNNLYTGEPSGTLVCDEDYLIRRFGKNNQLEYIGNLETRADGIIITDYMADSFIYSQEKTKHSYDSLLNNFIYSKRYVNAIIITDYKTKYADLFNYVQDIAIGVNRNTEKEYYREQMWKFAYDVQKYYGVNYSINPNYGEAINNAFPPFETVAHYGAFEINDILINFDNLIVYTDNILYGDSLNPTPENSTTFPQLKPSKQLISTNQDSNEESYTLGDYEIAMEYDIFNNLFGRILGSYTEENFNTFSPITITLNKYDGTENNNLVYSHKITIAKLLNNKSITWTDKNHKVVFGGKKIVQLINSNEHYVYGLYFDKASELEDIYSIINNNPYTVQSKIFNSIKNVGDIVNIFEDLFGLILIGIAGVCLILLVNYAYGNIKKRYYEIGVLKSLGATTKNVGFVFSLQTILAGLAICLLSNLSLIIFTKPINNLIANKLLEFINTTNVITLTILHADPITLIVNTLIICFVTIISCLLPLIKLNKIKPKNIIANKE